MPNVPVTDDSDQPPVIVRNIDVTPENPLGDGPPTYHMHVTLSAVARIPNPGLHYVLPNNAENVNGPFSISSKASVPATVTGHTHYTGPVHMYGAETSTVVGMHALRLRMIIGGEDVNATPVDISSLYPWNNAQADVGIQGYMRVGSHMSGRMSADIESINLGGIFYLSDKREVWTVEARLYEPDGKTFITVLPFCRGIQFQMENSKAGTGSFELPVHDPDLIQYEKDADGHPILDEDGHPVMSTRTSLVTDDRIVKFSWAGRERFGIVVKTANCELTTDGETWIKYSNQAGILSLLDRAVVMPEYMTKPADVWIPEMPRPGTMPKNAGTQRLFGYMSAWGPWAVSGDWVKPIGEVWNTAGSAKGANPALFNTLDKKAEWIAPPPGPTKDQNTGTTNYFRSLFTVPGTEAKTVTVYMSGDNFATVYLDGELIIEPDMDKPLSWVEAKSKSVELQPGTHLIAAHVLNGGVAVAPPLVIAKTNVNIKSTPNPLLGVTLAEGDRVQLSGQTVASQNGSYTYWPSVTASGRTIPGRLVAVSKANPIALIGDVVYMKTATGQPGQNIVKVELSGDILFSNDQADLTSQAKAALKKVAAQITVRKPQIKIDGHASSPGTAQHNMDLSEARAKSVWRYLKSLLLDKSGWTSADVVDDLSGSSVANVDIDWYGEERPKYTPYSDPRNRRVELAYPVAEPGVTSGSVLVPVVLRRTTDDVSPTTKKPYWQAHDGAPIRPGWFRASVLKKLIEEAKDQRIEGLSSITVAYGDLVGSDKVSWDFDLADKAAWWYNPAIHKTTRGQFSFNLVTTNLGDVASTLTEDWFDLELDAATMNLWGWKRRGKDLTTGDDAVRLSVGYGLLSYETTRTAPLATIVIGRLSDGTWFELKDAAAYAKYGRRVVGLSMSNAADDATARTAAQTILDENSHPTVVLTAKTSINEGPRPFRNWNIGDTVLVPGHKGQGVMPARCISITVDDTGDDLSVWSEFVIDTSSPSYVDVE